MNILKSMNITFYSSRHTSWGDTTYTTKTEIRKNSLRYYRLDARECVRVRLKKKLNGRKWFKLQFQQEMRIKSLVTLSCHFLLCNREETFLIFVL